MAGECGEKDAIVGAVHAGLDQDAAGDAEGISKGEPAVDGFHLRGIAARGHERRLVGEDMKVRVAGVFGEAQARGIA